MLAIELGTDDILRHAEAVGEIAVPNSAYQTPLLARYDADGAFVGAGGIHRGRAIEGVPIIAHVGGGDVAFAFPEDSYEAAPDGTALADISGVRGVWTAAGAFDKFAAIEARSWSSPVAALAHDGGLVLAITATGPIDDPLMRDPRYGGGALLSLSDTVEPRWLLPHWDGDANTAGPYVVALTALAGGDVPALLHVPAPLLFAGQSLTAGYYVLRVTP